MSSLDPTQLNHDIHLHSRSFQELFQHSPLAVYACDKLGYLNFYNLAAAALWGRRPVLGKERWSGAAKYYFNLVTTKQVIDNHNGNIQVISKPGQGSEFLISLNLKEVKPF